MIDPEVTRVFGLDIDDIDEQTAQEMLASSEAILQSADSDAAKATALSELGVSTQYSHFERGFYNRRFFVSEEVLRSYVAVRELHPARDTLRAARSISMLHEETLMLCYLFGSAYGLTVEVGPYIGGSTLAIARGIQDAGRSPMISIEKGGEYEHATLSSRDIVADLRANLEAENLTEHVDLVVGHMREAAITETVMQKLNGRRVDFLFIDSDGEVELDWEIFRDHLAYGGIVAFDDYESLDAGVKTAKIRPVADKLAADGILRPLGVFGWGTWFAQSMVPTDP